MERTKTILATLTGGFFLLLAFGALIKEPIGAAISMLLIAIIITPVTARLVNDKFSNKLTVPIRIVLSIVLLMVFGSQIESKPKAVKQEVVVIESSELSITDNALKWQLSSDDEKYSITKKIIEKSWRIDIFNAKTYDDVYGNFDVYAIALNNELNAAFEPNPDSDENKKLYTNQKIGDTAVILMTMKGWLK